MPRIASGVDLIEIERVKRAISKYGKRFLERIYTSAELAEVGDNPPSLAARFAAKEAVAKALGSGIGQVSWLEIEVLRGGQGEPLLRLYGAAQTLAEELGLRNWSLSISHTHEHAIAMVVGIEE